MNFVLPVSIELDAVTLISQKIINISDRITPLSLGQAWIDLILSRMSPMHDLVY
ncbi:MAG: hypothetical protein U9R17_19690 [Thermodesulfobacteriota bacterium]|nr:hypothetical protein [Thermodesulfobacteriota bacterium]